MNSAFNPLLQAFREKHLEFGFVVIFFRSFRFAYCLLTWEMIIDDVLCFD
jgi:hypothetical protein